MRILSLLVLMAGCAGDEPADTGRWFNPNPPDELGTDERPADVVLPEDYTVDRTWPLVIMLHGYGANSVVQDSIFGLGNRVDSMGFLLVKPDGTVDTSGRQFWNAFTECCDFGNTGVDDVGYLASLIEQARETYPISHVAFVGHSNGGYMSYRMACDRPDLIDRIAPLAGTLSAIPSECTGTEAVRVLHMHGTEDNSVAYESTSVHNGARASVEHFAALGGCSGPTSAGTRDYLASIDGEEHDIETWDCPGGDMQLWTGNEAGHVYLSNTDSYKDDLAAWLIAP